jgi:hypothetical protein
LIGVHRTSSRLSALVGGANEAVATGTRGECAPPSRGNEGVGGELASEPAPCYMSRMTDVEPRLVLEALSRGEISRTDAGRRLGEELSFGDMLARLREYGLRLPRFKSDPDSPGVRLIRDLASRSSRAE